MATLLTALGIAGAGIIATLALGAHVAAEVAPLLDALTAAA